MLLVVASCALAMAFAFASASTFARAAAAVASSDPSSSASSSTACHSSTLSSGDGESSPLLGVRTLSHQWRHPEDLPSLLVSDGSPERSLIVRSLDE